MREIKFILGQYADDMDVMSRNSQQDLNRIFYHINNFHKNTGFTLSYDKTSMYRVGAMHRSKAQLYTGKQMSWDKDTINVLGIDVFRNTDQLVETNFRKTIEKMKKTVSRWENRDLSLLGKVEIVNSLLGSLFVYKMSALPNMTSQMKCEINSIIQKYLWNNHKPKISLKTLQGPKNKGCAGLIDFERKEHALKTTWVKMLLEGKYPKSMIYNVLHKELRELIWQCNLKAADVKKVTDIPKEFSFWEDVLIAWCNFHFYEQQDGNCDQILWCNSLIIVDGAPIWWRIPHQHGLIWISQLFRDCDFKSDRELKEEFNLTTLQVNTLKSAIPTPIKNLHRKTEQLPKDDDKLCRFMLFEKGTRMVYKESLENVNLERLTTLWMRDCDISRLEIETGFSDIKFLTPVIKLRSFQYRLLHRALVTNIHLKRWGITSDDSCTFCQQTSEEVKHLLGECEYVIPIWIEVRRLVQEHGLEAHQVDLSYRNIILNTVHKDKKNVLNYICLIAKQYVYRQRCLKKVPNPKEFVSMVRNMKNIEKYYAVKDNKLAQFYKRWDPSNQSARTHATMFDSALTMDTNAQP